MLLFPAGQPGKLCSPIRRRRGDVRVTLLETDQTIDSHRSGKQVSIRFRIRLPQGCQRARRTYCGLKGYADKEKSAVAFANLISYDR